MSQTKLSCLTSYKIQSHSFLEIKHNLDYLNFMFDVLLKYLYLWQLF